MATNISEQLTAESLKISPNADVKDIQRIFQLQQDYRQTLKNTTAKERIRKIKNLRKISLSYRDRLKTALMADFRKPALEVDASEVYIVSGECKTAINNLRDWMEPTHIDSPLTYLGSASEIIHEPLGSSLIISPWNYPFNLTVVPLVSAIAAGNTAMIKPSEYTPHTSALMKEMLSEIFEDQEVAVIEGDHKISGELLNFQFDHIYFTGSPGVGKIVMKSAAEKLAAVTLELGGKSPTIIDETADLQDAVEKISWGKLFNGGQTCIAPDYLFIHESKLESFKKLIPAQIEKMYGKNVAESADYCRIVNAKHFNRINGLLKNAIESGADVVYGGESKSEENYISPTILTNVSFDSDIMKEEIFGPVLPVHTYKDLSEVIAYINSKEKPLAMYIFSKNNKNTDRLMNETSAGSTCINDTLVQFSQPNLIFGGVNHSGIGKGHGKWGFEAFTNKRAVTRQYLKQSAGKFLYPPYGKFPNRVIDLLIKWF